MSDKKNVSKSVNELVEELKANGSSRFSKADFQTLIYGILSDKDFKVKKHLIKNDEVVEEEYSINDGVRKFMDKLLKHAGMSKPEEREQIIDSFEYTPKDVEWIGDCVDEAMYIYTECDKNLPLFRDKMLQLTVKKMVRSGKFEGTVTYKKMVSDRLAALNKKLAKK